MISIVSVKLPSADVTVTVTVPLPSAVTSPAALTEAYSLPDVTAHVTAVLVALAGVTALTSCSVPPSVVIVAGALFSTETATAVTAVIWPLITISIVSVKFPSAVVTVTVTVPFARAVTTPVALTVANSVPEVTALSSNHQTAKNVIRKTARLANYHHSKWYVLYVELPHESSNSIALDKQRHLINNFKMATELGAEIIKVQHTRVATAIIAQAEERRATTMCVGKPHLSLLKVILYTNIFKALLNKLSSSDIDLIIVS